MVEVAFYYSRVATTPLLLRLLNHGTVIKIPISVYGRLLSVENQVVALNRLTSISDQNFLVCYLQGTWNQMRFAHSVFIKRKIAGMTSI